MALLFSIIFCTYFVSRSRRERTDDLYRAGVEHDSDGSTEALGREVVSELGSDETVVAVRAGDLAPDHSDLATLSFFRGSVDEGDALS